ncbi:MAG: T9SS type A sorting domain-containing protein [Bacteroidota bacterium]
MVNFNALSLSSGLYYYKLEAEDGSAVRKMIIK